MRIWLEVVGIPLEACDHIRRTVHESYQRFLYRNGSNAVSTALDLRGGTCPFTDRGYLSVQVHSPYPVEVHAIQQFAEAIYAAHPLRDDAVVRANRTVRVEDSPPGAAAEAAEDKRPIEEEISCWVCGRFDGEEYRDPASGTPRSLEVRADAPGRVPLCAVCRRLFEERRPAP